MFKFADHNGGRSIPCLRLSEEVICVESGDQWEIRAERCWLQEQPWTRSIWRGLQGSRATTWAGLETKLLQLRDLKVNQSSLSK